MKNAILRLDAGGQTGLGHLLRCLALARTMKSQGYFEPIIARYFSENTPTADYIDNFRVVDCRSSFGLPPVLSQNDIVIVDQVHNQTTATLSDFINYLGELKSLFRRVVLIDAGGKKAVRSYIPPGMTDLIIAPYVGEATSDTVLGGSKYAILDPAYCYTPARPLREKNNLVLMSFGGSDTAGTTLRIAREVCTLPAIGFHFRIVIGQGFSEEYRKQIETTAQQRPSSMTLVNAPGGLADELMACDLAIVTSGLTKYELAATGTPGIIIPLDEVHRDMDQAFQEAGCAIVVQSDITGAELVGTIENLMSNEVTYEQMSRRGQSLVDGHGANRIAVALERLVETGTHI